MDKWIRAGNECPTHRVASFNWSALNRGSSLVTATADGILAYNAERSGSLVSLKRDDASMLVPWLLAPHTTLQVYVLLLVFASPICFALYGLDKRRAIRQQPRISERTLQVAAFVGGWPGAWLGQWIFHHKTEKVLFRLLFWLIVAVHMGFIGLVLFGLAFR